MTALEEALISISNAREDMQRRHDRINNLKRVKVLREYAEKQRNIIKDYPIMEQMLRKEDFLARAAETLIYIMHNREALRSMEINIFKGNKKIMDRVLNLKRIGRQIEPLGQPLHVMVNFEVVKTIDYAI